MITAARRKSLSLAGLMFVKVNALRVVRHSGNPSKPVILWATDSGFVEVYFETSTRARGMKPRFQFGRCCGCATGRDFVVSARVNRFG